MTREVFDRAIEINSDINNVYAIQNVLGNSKNGKFLAAIEVKEFDSQRIVVEDCRVLNHVVVPKNIMEKFEKILHEELERLEREFREL